MRQHAPRHTTPGRNPAIDAEPAVRTPGKQTRSEGLVGGPTRDPSGSDVHAIAARGVQGGGAPLPFLDRIQALFGPRHDLSRIQAHVGGPAAEAAAAIGARAYAAGEHVAFASAPSLHTAAHEAAHVIQQRAGVELAGGVGAVGDTYERHADEVADAVVAGRSVAALLERHAGSGGGSAAAAIQRASVDTMGGTWTADPYVELKAGNGVHIHVLFAPNPHVDATKIGLVQTARSVVRNQAHIIEPHIGAKAAADGASIDQDDGAKTPVYTASPRDQTFGALSATTDDWAPDAERPWETGRDDMCLGIRHNGNVKNASLYDTPHLNGDLSDSSQIFETTAIAIAGAQQGTYYGSVEWGWTSDGNAKLRQLPFRVKSEGVPTASFMASARAWNQHTNTHGNQPLQLPVPTVTSISSLDAMATRELLQRFQANHVALPTILNGDAANIAFEQPALARELARRNAKISIRVHQKEGYVSDRIFIKMRSGHQHTETAGTELGTGDSHVFLVRLEPLGPIHGALQIEAWRFNCLLDHDKMVEHDWQPPFQGATAAGGGKDSSYDMVVDFEK